MSLLFSKNGKRAVKYVWIALSIIIILSMIFAYSGAIGF